MNTIIRVMVEIAFSLFPLHEDKRRNHKDGSHKNLTMQEPGSPISKVHYCAKYTSVAYTPARLWCFVIAAQND